MPRVRVLLPVPLLAASLLAVAAPAAPAAATAAAPAIRNPIRFGDTFDNGRLDGWSVASETRAHGPARWVVTGTSLRQTSNVFAGPGGGVAKPGTNLLAGNPAWRDYDFGVTARSLDDDALGIVFRYVDRDNFYRFSIDRQLGRARLVAKVHGTYRVVAQKPWRYVKGRKYRLQVHAVGSDLRAYVDGRQLLQGRDAHLSHGRFGLYTWSDAARFDSVRAAVASTGSFTIAVLPDTQYESESRPAMFRAQSRWLARNRASQNIVAVLHEGDVVNRLEQSRQWRNARTALNYVAGKIPLTVAAGNHDVQKQHRRNPRTTYGGPFATLIKGLPNYHVDGSYGSMRNTYQLLDAGGVRFVIVNLTYGPSDKQLRWAGRVADRYRDRHVIMLTHDYLGQDGRVRGSGDRNLPSKSGSVHNDGIDIWRKFVATHANVQFTFNGHVIQHTRGTDYAVARRVSRNAAARRVYQVLTNFQTDNSGGGYLRLVRFTPSLGRVDYSTYSPYLHRSLTDGNNRFSFRGVDLS